jgi:hypothetical protein
MTPEEKFCFRINVIWFVQSPLQKYSRSGFTQITSISPAVPAHRGAFRDRHGRWARDAVDATAPARDGMAGRVSREPLPGTQTNGAVSDFAKARRTGTKPGEAFGEDGSRTAKSCGPDASTPASSPAEASRPDRARTKPYPPDDGDNKARSPGRARRKPLKPLRAGMPGVPVRPW